MLSKGSQVRIDVQVDNQESTSVSNRNALEDVSFWNNCISREFPITQKNIINKKAVCQVGKPHLGCYILSSAENESLDGEAHIYSSDGKLMADLFFVRGEANGRCTLYYKSGEQYFVGNLTQGYRNGVGLEYSKDGTIIYDGFYKNGRRDFHITNRTDRPDYWNERDEFGGLVAICQKDDTGVNHGTCYFFSKGCIEKISRWEHGKEIETLHVFEGDIMKSYINRELVYSGKYLKKSEFEYIPDKRILKAGKNQKRSKLKDKSKENVKSAKVNWKELTGFEILLTVIKIISCLIVVELVIFIISHFAGASQLSSVMLKLAVLFFLFICIMVLLYQWNEQRKECVALYNSIH